MSPYTPPTIGVTAFNCPFCGAYANQTWFRGYKSRTQNNGYKYNDPTDIELGICVCNRCAKESLWLSNLMIYPAGGSAPLPNSDMPDDIQQDYEEARSVLNLSPKSSAALLRLALQKLCIHLGGKGKNINDDIKYLVAEKHLPVMIQQALDTVRIVGNNAVHPGEIDLADNDNLPIITALFNLLNMIVDNQITQPKKMAELYGSLPGGALAAVAKRDGIGS